MAKFYPLIRISVIISELRKRQYLDADGLIDAIARKEVLDGEYFPVSKRTLQRDIKDIYKLFGIEIKCNSSGQYFIAGYDRSIDDYEDMLLNFELLSSIDSDSTLQKYVIAEHRRANFGKDFPLFLNCCRECMPAEFDYILFRHNGDVIHKVIKPYCLKESQHRWYVIGMDDSEELKSFALDRILNASPIMGQIFRRRSDIDIPSMYKDCFGIWNDPSIPVEEIVLKYDTLDGSFVKTFPLHHSQEIISDNEHGLKVRLRLRITNDFVMELLSRGRSIEVIKPLSLRKRLYEVFSGAMERNKI